MSLVRKALREGADFLVASLSRPKSFQRVSRAGPEKEYLVSLPAGYPAARIRVRLSVPNIRSARALHFSEHVMDGAGRASDMVVAGMAGGFAISRDLGRSWEFVNARGSGLARFTHLKWIGNDEFLAQTQPIRRTIVDGLVDLLVVDVKGSILAKFPSLSMRWHGCRSVDHANGTLMYAEYPANGRGSTRKAPSRVFRSRDRGRNWEVVFECSGTEVRHFHFLQARPGNPGEWWLSSGDKPSECHIWRTTDDGSTWENVTKPLSRPLSFGGMRYERDVFRLTDLAWENGALLWGTDDAFSVNKRAPGACVFKSEIASPLHPKMIGRGKWEIRSMVDIGDFYMFLTQGGNRRNATQSDRIPGAFLMPKQHIDGAPNLVHLFDIDVYSTTRTGFTYSRASRSAKDGTFFTYRRTTDAFPSGHNLLRWDVALL